MTRERERDIEEHEEHEERAAGGETLAPDPLEGLDLQHLDLTVETVEERISPSETNVFDK